MNALDHRAKQSADLAGLALVAGAIILAVLVAAATWN